MSGKAEQKSFTTPDETRSFDHGALDLLQIGGAEIGRLTLQPGWRWSDNVKPLAGTELCEAPHFQYHVSGTLHVVMAMAPSSTRSAAMSPPCRKAMTPGWSATNRSSWWTGTAPATTPAHSTARQRGLARCRRVPREAALASSARTIGLCPVLGGWPSCWCLILASSRRSWSW